MPRSGCLVDLQMWGGLVFYLSKVSEAVIFRTQAFKFKHFGHDNIVLHENVYSRGRLPPIPREGCHPFQ